MIGNSEEEAELFIGKVKELLISVTSMNVDSKEYILIVGPTGSGKSTIINIIAGSQIVCLLNKKNKWEITAEPSVATIGHSKSTTLLPNYWEDAHGNRYFDCPGFNDTRGEDYEIAKSYFLTAIAKKAKGLKVMLVVDYFTLNSKKCGPFSELMDELKLFLPHFNIS